MRLYTKFILLISAVTLGLGLSSSFLVSRMMNKALDRQLRDQAMLAAQTLAEHITHNVIDGEVIPAREAAVEIVDRLETIKYVYIIGFDSRVFAHTFEGGFPKAFVSRIKKHVPVYMRDLKIAEYATDTGRVLDVAAPLIEGMAAHVHIGMNEELVQEQIASLRNRIIGLSMVLALIGIVVGAIVSRRLTTPLAQMADSMRDFGEGRREEEIDFAGRGKEIADLTSAFNRMITERKQNDEKRERVREFMQTVIDGLPEPMMVVNRDYTIAMTNRATREITKGKDPVTASLKCYQVFHKLETPCSCDKHPCPMKEVIKNKVPVTFEHIHYDAHGQEVIVELTASPIFDKNGEVIQIIESSHDITERKQAEDERKKLLVAIEAKNQHLMASEQQLKAANQQLSANEQQLKAANQQLSANEQQLKATNQQLSANEQQLRASNQQANALNHQLIASQQELSLKNEELQSIVYISSHDLKAPLVNINGFSELLIEHCDEMKELVKKCDVDTDTKKVITSLLNEDIPTDLEYIGTSAKRMKRLIEGLLQVSRIGTVELKTQKINMNDVISEIIDTVKYKTEDLKAQIICKDLPDCIGDKDQITQVFTNLIGNALKYLSPDRKGCICVTGKTKNTNSIYCIEDNGIGIEQAYYGKIFEIYHRLNPQTSTEGDGLGLTIVRRVLDRHKGTIWLESKPEEGTKFFVKMPAKK